MAVPGSQAAVNHGFKKFCDGFKSTQKQISVLYECTVLTVPLPEEQQQQLTVWKMLRPGETNL